ncbi:hypothetical protein GALMADRAFT_462449 [Galerina marginata CBS 339.88]|uniref:Uncharacterized protein n=1 Tax=Galerina marginata (strain CBS 339.88) TaxID=685588 RepID=A0A067SZ19_GALM3|nr:hypothetical protein GALMADRAFT_462449 [Galerina marginata CBS 339.88]
MAQPEVSTQRCAVLYFRLFGDSSFILWHSTNSIIWKSYGDTLFPDSRPYVTFWVALFMQYEDLKGV